MKKIIHPIVAALGLAGCTNGTMPPLSELHPANPGSAQAGHAPHAPFLMNDTNFIAVTAVSTNASEHEHAHDSKAKPETKTPPKHEND